jgi:hypothetical protein
LGRLGASFDQLLDARDVIGRQVNADKQKAESENES